MSERSGLPLAAILIISFMVLSGCVPSKTLEITSEAALETAGNYLEAKNEALKAKEAYRRKNYNKILGAYKTDMERAQVKMDEVVDMANELVISKPDLFRADLREQFEAQLEKTEQAMDTVKQAIRNRALLSFIETKIHIYIKQSDNLQRILTIMLKDAAAAKGVSNE